MKLGKSELIWPARPTDDPKNFKDIKDFNRFQFWKAIIDVFPLIIFALLLFTVVLNFFIAYLLFDVRHSAHAADVNRENAIIAREKLLRMNEEQLRNQVEGISKLDKILLNQEEGKTRSVITKSILDTTKADVIKIKSEVVPKYKQ